MSAIWKVCADTAVFVPLAGEVLRMVESQEEVATLGVVDTLAEQAALERLLEASKPIRPKGQAPLHYLLATPFRYPPLRHGSRFGGRFERSLFYGALDRQPLLMEASYYRFVFQAGLAIPFPFPLQSSHTAFAGQFSVAQGARLEEPPFAAFEATLRSPDDYRETQALGQALRAAGIDAFTFRSARDPDGGLNAALVSPTAFVSPRPTQQTPWAAETSAREVVWREQGAHEVVTIAIESFLVDGALPSPAV